MSFVPPCRRPENDPDDWFIESNGRQYRDEPLVDSEDIRLLSETLLEGETLEEAVADLTEERIKANLIKRRHAKDKCWTECIARVRLGTCLEAGMRPENIDHGIWGGYDASERRKIQAAKEERDRQ